MSRLPVRVRLSLAFALAMAAVLSAVGAFLYLRLGDSLLEQVDDGLQARAEVLSAQVREGESDLSPSELSSGDDEGFGQLVAPDGSLLASSPTVPADPLISRSDVERASLAPFFLRKEGVPGLGDAPARLLVSPLESQNGTLALVVGASLEDREEALGGLLTQLFVIGPLALVASSLAGYLLAAAALRPVEAMRRRAEEVSTEQLARRLPLPEAHDEVQRLGRTLNAMLDRLEAGVLRERRFVADASHELRTPLALLQAELELALRRPRSQEDLERALRSAGEEVDRLILLAEDLLILARVDEGRLALRRSSISAADLLATVARRFAVRAEAEGRTLEVVPSSDVSIVADRVRLEQALGNLVDNALRHGAGSVQLEAGLRDGRIELRVSDQGRGFPPEFLPRAFDRFARAEESRGRGASGLGLSIVEAIARAHGGTARADNDGEGGAVVSLTIPTGGKLDGEAESAG